MIELKRETIPSDILEEIITLGEGYKTEFKESLPSPDAIARTICAFSNTKGGNIFVGITRNGIPVGIEDEQIEISKLEEALPIIIPQPGISASLVQFKDRVLLFINISEGNRKPYYVKNERGLKSYIRVGELNIQATKKVLKRFINNSRIYGYGKKLSKEEKIVVDIFSQNKKLNLSEVNKILNFSERKTRKILKNLCKRGFIIPSEEDGSYYYNETITI